MYSQCCGGNRPLEMEETTASRLDGSIGHVYNSRGVWTGGTESPHHQLTPCSAGGGGGGVKKPPKKKKFGGETNPPPHHQHPRVRGGGGGGLIQHTSKQRRPCGIKPPLRSGSGTHTLGPGTGGFRNFRRRRTRPGSAARRVTPKSHFCQTWRQQPPWSAATAAATQDFSAVPGQPNPVARAVQDIAGDILRRLCCNPPHSYVYPTVPLAP